MGRGEFTDAEDANLLAALLKYGPMDLHKVAENIPSRNEYQVKQRMLALQKQAQRSLTSIKREYKNGKVKFEPRDKVALDRWLDHLINLHDKAEILLGTQEELPVRMLARSMGHIAKYEEHPTPEECNGVDFRNVYEFLESMMMGLPSKTLNSMDAKFLIQALQRLSTSVDREDVGKETAFLLCGRPQWRAKGQKPRTYGKQEEDMAKDDLLEFVDSVRFNPFQVPKEYLKRNMETL